MQWSRARWKRRERAVSASVLPAPVDTPQPSLPSAPEVRPVQPADPKPPFKRPDSFIGLLSDLTRYPKEGVMFVFIVGGIVLIIAACVTGGEWVITEACKNLKGNALAVTAAGISGTSLLSFLTSLIVRLFRNHGKDSDNDFPS